MAVQAIRSDSVPTGTGMDPEVAPAAPATARDEEAGIPPEMRAQRQRGSIPSFLILSFVLFMLTNHNGDEFLARHQYQDALQSLNYQLSNYTAWMNGTESNLTVVSIVIQ